MSQRKHEKRRHTRVAAQADDVYHLEFKCLDLSESGLRLESKQKIRTGATIAVELRALAEPITVNCRVKWCKESASVYKDMFHVGVQFEDLSVTNQIHLRELIESRE